MFVPFPLVFCRSICSHIVFFSGVFWVHLLFSEKQQKKNYMRTGAPATKNPDKTILEQMLRKTTEKKI
jgi:hypothetical protein